jgi:hypothetical protein
MSNFAIIPNVAPIKIVLDERFTLEIIAGFNGKFAVGVSNTVGEYVPIPEELLVYNIYKQRYLETISDGMFYQGSLLEVYEIYYKKTPVLINSDYYAMEDYFDSPTTTNEHYYKEITKLFKGDVCEGTNIISVSAVEQLDVGYGISGNGIPPFSSITAIHYGLKLVQINKKATGSFSNNTLTVC